MGNISVNITELRHLLDVTPSSHNIMLVGNHGIGKSEILTEYFSAKGMPVTALFLGQMSDPGDIIGLPDKDPSTGKTIFRPPYWFPTDGKPMVLFLDELNRARPEILQTVMDLALNRKLAGRKLPEGSRIISAVNMGDQYQLTDLDPALVSRFNIVNFKPTVAEWLLWAKKEGVDQRVIDFISDNRLWLDKDPDSKENADMGLDKMPDRRAWKRVSDIVKGRPHLTASDGKVISSIVGGKAASSFLSSISNRKLITGKEVLLLFGSQDLQKELDTYKLHQLSAVNEDVYRHLEVDEIPSAKVPQASANLEAYFRYLAKNKKEAAAHFANVYIQQTYPKAIFFIARECRNLTGLLIDYIKTIN